MYVFLFFFFFFFFDRLIFFSFRFFFFFFFFFFLKKKKFWNFPFVLSPFLVRFQSYFLSQCLLRSQSDGTLNLSNPGLLGPQLSHDSMRLSHPTLPKSLTSAPRSIQSKAAAAMFEQRYRVKPRPLQVEAVVSLINGRNTFLLAGTGYGKTRIAELFFSMFPRTPKPVVLVLNPLDALGDNQVSCSAVWPDWGCLRIIVLNTDIHFCVQVAEKSAVGLMAINLTKSTMNKKVVQEIRMGFYQFIYLVNSHPYFDRVNTLGSEPTCTHRVLKSS